MKYHQFHLIPERLALIKKSTMTSVEEDVEKRVTGSNFLEDNVDILQNKRP